MGTPKKYLQDRSVLLLLCLNTFLAVFSSILVMLKFDPSRSAYVVQRRAQLGPSFEFTNGPASELFAFILFAIFVLAFHTFLSVKVYHIRRHFSLAVLGMGLLLLAFSVAVSSSLLINQ